MYYLLLLGTIAAVGLCGRLSLTSTYSAVLLAKARWHETTEPTESMSTVNGLL